MQQLKERLIQIFRRSRDEETTELDIENLERDLEFDALREENTELLRRIVRYQDWHIQSLQSKTEE